MTFPKVPLSAMNTYEARNRNLAAVFETIRESAGVSRTEIGLAMPFSLQTVTNVSQELIAMGLIREGTRLRVNAKGKPHTALHVVPERGYALGVQIRWNSVSTCLIDLEYRVVDEAVTAIAAFDATAFLGEVIALLRATLARHAGKDVWAVGLSAPLPVASHAMSALQPASFNWADSRWFESFWSRHSVGSLREAIAQALGLPTSILNNPQSAAIAEALHAPVQARLVYIMLGLSLGAAFVNGRELNQDLWRYAGEIGYVIYRDAPLNRILSVSGLRDFLGLPQPQGEYEPIVAATLAQAPDRLAPWFEQAAERLRLIVNFLENTMRPDGVVIGGFVPNGYLEELVRRVAPLPSSVVLDEHDPTRIVPRLAVARHSVESIPFGAAAMTLSSRANPRFPALIGARRGADSAADADDAV